MNDLRNKKIALIADSSRDIGFETARQLARAGIHVILAGRGPNKIDGAAKKLSDQQISVESVYFDVADIENTHKPVNPIESKFGHLDVLVNNAGILVDDNEKILLNTFSHMEKNIRDKSFRTCRYHSRASYFS